MEPVEKGEIENQIIFLKRSESLSLTIWVRISFLSFFPAYVCGYTKDEGAVVILLRRNPKEYVIEIA